MDSACNGIPYFRDTFCPAQANRGRDRLALIIEKVEIASREPPVIELKQREVRINPNVVNIERIEQVADVLVGCDISAPASPRFSKQSASLAHRAAHLRIEWEL